MSTSFIHQIYPAQFPEKFAHAFDNLESALIRAGLATHESDISDVPSLARAARNAGLLREADTLDTFWDSGTPLQVVARYFDDLAQDLDDRGKGSPENQEQLRRASLLIRLIPVSFVVSGNAEVFSPYPNADGVIVQG